MLTSLAIQSWHHRFFANTPTLLTLARSDRKDILAPFLVWANENNLPMDWTTHVHLLNWLMQQEEWQPLITSDIVKELMSAAVTRWSLSGLDHPAVQGILLASHCMPDKAVGLWKSDEPHKSSRIVVVKLPPNLRPTHDAYALSWLQNSWDGVEWVGL